jgi:Spy/CpxP family protein refolding chaperone
MITKSIALAVALIAGCTQSASPSPGAQTQAGTEATEPHEMHAPSGPAILFFAAQRLDLTADQRTTIETAAKSIATDVQPDPRIFKELAAGVRAGKVDEAHVLAIVDASARSTDPTVSPAAALATLHATLRPEQRRALVDLIAKHIDQRESAMVESPGSEGRFEQVLSKLKLTSDQRASIDRIVAAQPVSEDRAAMPARMESFHAQLRARLDTFASDQFDATAFTTLSPTGMTMRDHIQRTVHMLATIVPTLDATQRETLAAMIEAGPLHH